MKIRTLVVDDSAFFRRVVTRMLTEDPDIDVVGEAQDGAEAVKKAILLEPNVVVMDVEMPVMDGITAVKQIMAAKPCSILMFSALTHEGAKATLDALEAGAADFLPKKFEDIAIKKETAAAILRERVKALARQIHRPSIPKPKVVPLRPPAPAKKGRHELVAIASSTGGPVALSTILEALPKGFPLPIVIAQHMPPAFTGPFAERLNGICAIGVHEAQEGSLLESGVAFIAPGGKNMLVERGSQGFLKGRIKIVPPGEDIIYKPNADLLFQSCTRAFGGRVLAIVLTGMGADGAKGAQAIKESGGEVWAQDEKTSTIYGMPKAVVERGLADRILPVDKIAQTLMEVV